MPRTQLALATMIVLLCGTAAADTFDLATYAAPSGWTREDGSHARGFTTVDRVAGTFCQISLHAATASLGSAERDFDADWRELVATPFKASAPKVGAPSAAGAWTITSGAAAAKWREHDAAAALFVLTGGGNRFSVVYFATGDCAAALTAFMSKLVLAAPAGSTARPAPAVTNEPAPASTVKGGWTITAQAGFVEARGQQLTVRLHYVSPIPDALRGDPDAKRDHFWNTLIAPRYTDATNVQKPRIEAYAASEMMEADLIEAATHQRAHVAMHQFTENGLVNVVEIVAPSKQALDAAYPDATRIAALRDLNRFALSTADVTGAWRDSSGAFASYYNIYTGDSAGVGVASSTYKVAFKSNGTFTSEVKAVVGRTGQLSFGQENRAGRWKVADGWTLETTAAGVKRAYAGWFEAVRGGKVLHLVDKAKSAMHDVLARQR